MTGCNDRYLYAFVLTGAAARACVWHPSRLACRFRDGVIFRATRFCLLLHLGTGYAAYIASLSREAACLRFYPRTIFGRLELRGYREPIIIISASMLYAVD